MRRWNETANCWSGPGCCAAHHGYGTPRAPVEAALAAGEDMVFDIDWQGFRQLRDRLPGDVVGVFILPPGLDVLEQRLRARGGEHPAEVDRRMRDAREEISHWQEFDFASSTTDWIARSRK